MVKKRDMPPKSVQEMKDRENRLPTGVEGSNVPDDFSIPASAIEDVDRALFNLFEKRLRLTVNAGQQQLNVPTIFAGGERVFMLKGNHPPHDKAGAFILPIVSIKRTGIDQSRPGLISGRGMGQSTGDLVIRKRLSSRDPRYQSMLNPLNIQNQDNVASPKNVSSDIEPIGSIAGRVASRRGAHPTFNTWTGELLAPSLGNNIFEIITMPFPHFYTAIYEITFWTQYVQHMNSILERFMTSYDAQGNQFRLDTDKGYWYVAYVDDSISSADNFNDYTDDERFVRYRMTCRVPAYLHGAERHGSGNPFRSFLSAPQISFQIVAGGPPIPNNAASPGGSGDIDKFTLRDVDLLDKRGDHIDDERTTTERVPQIVHDPFGDNSRTRYVRVLSRNQRKGETVMSSRILDVIDDVEF